MGSNHGGEVHEEVYDGPEGAAGAGTEPSRSPADAAQPADREFTTEQYEQMVTRYVAKIVESTTIDAPIDGRSQGLGASVNAPPRNLPVQEQSWMLPIHRWATEPLKARILAGKSAEGD